MSNLLAALPANVTVSVRFVRVGLAAEIRRGARLVRYLTAPDAATLDAAIGVALDGMR